MFRYLRIAFSATCLIACVLLIALWVRSYWWMDGVDSPEPPLVWEVISGRGHILIVSFQLSSVIGTPARRFYSERINATNPGPFLLFGFRRWPNVWAIGAPDWFLVVLSAALAAAPWIRWRFSLRTLLIATTFIAVVLGFLAIST